MEDNYHRLRRRITRGYPQGSVLGPKLWKLIMDTLLSKLTQLENTHPIAYAYNLAILIAGKSRAELERRRATAIEAVQRWASVNKLVASKEKTTGLMLKGLLSAERPPHIMFIGSGIGFA